MKSKRSQSKKSGASVRKTVPKTPRNPIAQNPLLKKGGVHIQSRKSERAKHKNALRSLMRNANLLHCMSAA